MSGPNSVANAAMITQYYENILQRAPEAAGLANWVAAADSGAMTMSQIETAIAVSPEAQAVVVPVIDLYAAFGRAPDQAGLALFTHVLDQGTTLNDVAGAFLGSPEGQSIYGTAAGTSADANIAFVSTIYQEVLGRTAETAGLQFWTGLIASGTPPAQVLLRIAQSDEAQARTRGPINNFLLAAGQGTANYGGSLGLPDVVAQTHTLTTGVDVGAAFVGGLGNDVFNADEVVSSSNTALPTWTVGDVIDGGAGKDSFNVVQSAAIANPVGSKVTNIETGNFTSGAGITLDTTAWTGLTKLNATSIGTSALNAASTTDIASTTTGLGAGGLTVNGGNNVDVVASGSAGSESISVGGTTAPVGAVTVAATFAPLATSTGGSITVTGGTTVSVVENAANARPTTATLGTVNVNGGALTTAVSVTEAAAATASGSTAGVVDSAITVNDVNTNSLSQAGTIASMAASNYTILTINDNALTALSVLGGSGNITVNNGNLTTPTNLTLNATLAGLTGGSLIDSGVYTALNITTTGAASRLANISEAAVTALKVAGTTGLTLTSTAGLAGLKTVAVSGAAGLTADLSISGTVTAIDTSASTGASTITMDASQATFNGGAGVDTVTVTNHAVSKAISLGSGDDSLTLGASGPPTAFISGGAGTDTLSMDSTSASTASQSSAFANDVTGFERLVLTGATNQTIQLATLGIAGFVTTRGGNGLSLQNMSNGGTLVLNGPGTAYTVSNPAFSSGTNDLVNLVLSANNPTNFATTGITMPNVETIAITTQDTETTPSGFDDTVTLLGNTAKTVTVAGNAGLSLTATDTALTSVDASGIALGDFTYTSGALAAAAAIKGSASGANTVDFSAAGGAVSYTGGSGNDNVTASNGNDNIVALGNGNNQYTGGDGNSTVTAGSGADTVVVGNGNNSVSLGDGANSFTAGSGANTYVGGSGADVVTVGAGANNISLGAGANVLNLSAANTAVATFTTLLDPTAGDRISFANFGTEVFNSAQVTLAPGATLQNFADAVVVAGGDASVNGHFGWFQFGGDTYLEESRHDGTGVQSFQTGSDVLVKLSGSVNLANAVFTGTQSLVLG